LSTFGDDLVNQHITRTDVGEILVTFSDGA